jgi:hypothetical protein
MAFGVNTADDKYILCILIVLVILLFAMISGGKVGQILFSFGTVLFFAFYLLIGTQSSADRYTDRLFQSLAAGLVIILGIGFALLWYFHFQNPEYIDPIYWFGFPRATAIVVYVIWMPPALYLMFSYPYLFEKYIWSEDQAEEFRQLNRTAATADGTVSGEQNTPADSTEEEIGHD